MIRRVAYGKAVRSGAAGALVWVLAIEACVAAGLPVFDFVHGMGTLLLPHSPRWQWMTAGILLHIGIGAAWAIFYAYFFWTEFPWRPAMQGLAFASIPALLAGLVMVPQLHGMSPQFHADHVGNLGVFARHLGPWGPLSILGGHAIYGLTLGSLYTHPVGYPAQPRRGIWSWLAHG
jgi:hypothetical protein